MHERKQKAQEQLRETIDHHQGELSRYLRYLGTPPDLVADLCQEAFLAWWRECKAGREPRKTAAFLIRVAKNRLIDHSRRRSSKTLSLDIEEADQRWAELSREIGDQTFLAALADCVARLNGKAARLLQLRFNANLKSPEIAKAMGITATASRQLMLRTKARLKECLEGKLS